MLVSCPEGIPFPSPQRVSQPVARKDPPQIFISSPNGFTWSRFQAVNSGGAGRERLTEQPKETAVWSPSITCVSPGKRTGKEGNRPGAVLGGGDARSSRLPGARFPGASSPLRGRPRWERLRRSGTGTAGYLEPPILPSQDALRSPAPPQGLIVPGAQRADEKENT